jgi:hypothetical protein
MEDGQQEQSPPAPAAPLNLITLDDAKEHARWNELSEEELQQEIAQYRIRLESLAKDRASAGAAVNGQSCDGVHLDAHSITSLQCLLARRSYSA